MCVFGFGVEMKKMELIKEQLAVLKHLHFLIEEIFIFGNEIKLRQSSVF